MALLDVRNLELNYTTAKGSLMAVDDVSFQLASGESVGLVGESGCGKTTVAKSLLRLLPKNANITGGQIIFQGEDLVTKTKEEIRRLRLKDIAMIAQSAMNSLNPVYSVGDQIIEGIRAHSNMTRKQAQERVVEVFEMVGLEAKRLNNYPHQMSGGMKQRAIIAMALSLKPALIVADEPTTALDVVVQDRILQRIVKIQKEINSSMVFITHDISVVSEVCETIIVMYGGKIMEKAPTGRFFRAPFHPYSLGLQNAFPSIGEMGEELISIPGSPPNLMNPQPGCRFRERCPFAQEVCSQPPPLKDVDNGHLVACHFTEKVSEFRNQAKDPATWQKVRQRLIEGRMVK